MTLQLRLTDDDNPNAVDKNYEVEVTEEEEHRIRKELESGDTTSTLDMLYDIDSDRPDTSFSKLKDDFEACSLPVLEIVE